ITLFCICFAAATASCNEGAKTQSNPDMNMNDSTQIAQLISLDNGSIKVEDFFKNPQRTGYKISPNGEYLSYLGPYQTRLNVFVQKIGSAEQPVRITNQTDRDITAYFWANDN